MGLCNNSEDSVGFRAPRCLSDVLYGQNHPAAKEIRCGSLERRTKILKSYNTGFYVLTPSGFLHEFKSSNFNCGQTPIMSLSLRDYEISDHSPVNAKSYKFSLKGYKNEYSSRSHILIFRTRTYQELLDWYNDIKMFAGRSYMSDEEYRDYIVALQMKNISDNKIIHDQNGVFDREHLSQESDSDFKDTVDVVAASVVPYQGTQLQTLDTDYEGDKINEKETSFIEKDKFSIHSSDNVFSVQNFDDNVSTHAPVLLDSSNACLNDSDNQKEVATLKSSLRDSSYYSSTDECPCPLKSQKSFDSEPGLNRRSIDVEKSLDQESGSLHVPLESQINNSKLSVLLESQTNNSKLSVLLESQTNNQNLCPILPSTLDQSPISVTVQSKSKEDLGESVYLNTDTAYISTDKLSLEKVPLPVSVKSAESLINEEHGASNRSSKVLDTAKPFCSPQESLNKLECQMLSGTFDSAVLENSCLVDEPDGDLQEQVLNNSDIVLKESNVKV